MIGDVGTIKWIIYKITNPSNRGVKYSIDVCEKKSALYSQLFGKQINQYTSLGEYITTFPSIKSASKKTGIKIHSIKSSLNNPRTKYKDFIFKYK